MTGRAKRLAEIADSLFSEMRAGGWREATEPRRDLAEVAELIGPMWLRATGEEFAEQCYQHGLAQGRLHDLYWGLVVGYQIARREAAAGDLAAMFEANEGGR